MASEDKPSSPQCNEAKGTTPVALPALYRYTKIDATNTAGTGSTVTTMRRNLKKLSHQLSLGLRHKAIVFGWPITPDGYVPVRDVLNHSMFRNYTLRDIIEVVQTNDKQRYALQERPLSNYYTNNTNVAESSTETDSSTSDGRNVPEPVIVDSNVHDTKSGTGSKNIADRALNVTQSTMILCIRANQGHSIPLIHSDLLLQRLSSDDLLQNYTIMVHGTYRQAWGEILSSGGLSKMQRNHIHFATGVPHQCSNNERSSSNKSTNPEVISGMRQTCDVYIYINIQRCVVDQIPIYKSDNGVLLSSGINDSGILPLHYISHVTDSSGTILWTEQ